jgi:acetyl-CoA carboxylase beta subunit
MPRSKKDILDHEFFDQLANQSPNSDQFNFKKKTKSKKIKKKNKITTEPDTGWSGIV